VTDVRKSVRETIIRSIEAGRLELHPKLPKCESLRDCMERTIPYWRCARRRRARTVMLGDAR
jgi:bisphosphoglycerate-dependent phosphoglycerate mutase